MVVSSDGQESGGAMEQVGDNIIHHVSNSDIHHPIFPLPHLFNIDMSVTKHVLMLWIVALTVGFVVILPIQRYVQQRRLIPTGLMNVLEIVVSFVRDTIVKPNVGPKWVNSWAPLILTFLFFIFFANAIGMIPIFDVLGLVNRFVFHVPADDSLTFLSIIIAGTKAHGFIQHWKNLVPHGLPGFVYIILIPIEIIGMLVKPFALTMRLAANMTGGHIALLAILSFMAIFADMFHSVSAGLGVALISVPLAAAISGLEIIIIIVQAYVFTLLSAVFIGMAINVHH